MISSLMNMDQPLLGQQASRGMSPLRVSACRKGAISSPGIAVGLLASEGAESSFGYRACVFSQEIVDGLADPHVVIGAEGKGGAPP